MTRTTPQRTTCSRLRRTGTSGLLALVLAGGGLALASPASAGLNPQIARIEGADRFETSAEVSFATWDDGTVETVVIASGLSEVDGLSAAALAGQVNGPVLLVPPAGPLPDVTVAELDRLGALNAIIVGGEAAVSPAVQAELAGLGLAVRRLGGANRYATASLVAKDIGTAAGTSGGLQTAFLATGATFADALAASAPAFAGVHPILLTGGTTLNATTRDVLDDGTIRQVYVLGGEQAVPATVAAEVEALGITVRRIQGADRFQTATALAARLVADFGFLNDTVTVTTGLNFADALSAGPYSGEFLQPILFAETDAAKVYIEANDAPINVVDVIGGPRAVSDVLAEELRVAAISDVADTTAPVVVSTVPDQTTDVSVITPIQATFNEILRVQGSTATVTGPGGVAVEGNVSVTTDTITFTPSVALQPGTTYEVVFTGTDTAGNASAPVTVGFTTAAAPDTTAPQFVSATPAEGDVDVAVEGPLSAVFDESVASATATLTGPGGAEVAGATGVTGPTVTFTPTAALEFGTAYTATFTATDAAGNASAPVAVTFTTAAAPDTTAPLFVSSAPAEGDVDVSVTTDLSATFDEAVVDATVTLTGPDGEVAGTTTASGTTVGFDPTGDLAAGTIYTATFTASDAAGNASTAATVTFTTAATVTAGPGLLGTTPDEGSVSGVGTLPAARYDAPLDQGTSTASLDGPSGTVLGSVSFSSSARIVFTPDAPLEYRTPYTATFTVFGLDGGQTVTVVNFTTPAPPATP